MKTTRTAISLPIVVKTRLLDNIVLHYSLMFVWNKRYIGGTRLNSRTLIAFILLFPGEFVGLVCPWTTSITSGNKQAKQYRGVFFFLMWNEQVFNVQFEPPTNVTRRHSLIVSPKTRTSVDGSENEKGRKGEFPRVRHEGPKIWDYSMN